VEISGLQNNWEEHVQPHVQHQTQPHRSSITASHPDSGDEFDDQNDQAAPKVQAIQKNLKQQTTAKVNMPGQSNHQKGTKTVLFIY
jgi:hypothetical protein